MKRLRLGIAGGCLNTGYGLIPLSKVYHRVLAKRVKSARDARLRVHLASLESHEPGDHLRSVDKLLEKRNVEALIYQVRPEFLWMQTTWIWKRRERTGPGSIRLNSCHRAADGWTLKTPDCRPIGKLRGLNWSLGRLFGKENQAWNCVRDMLTEVKNACDRRDVRFAVLGSIAGPWYLPSFHDHAHNKVNGIIHDLDIPFIDLRAALTETDDTIWFEDGRHLNETGHERIAETVLPFALQWLAARPEEPAEE